MANQPNRQQITVETGRIDYNFLIMDYAQALSKQLLKLPNEIVSAELNENTGCLRSDILESYCQAVEHFEAMLLPYHTPEYRQQITDLGGKTYKSYFAFSKDKFGCLLCLCNQKGWLQGLDSRRRSAANREIEVPE